MSNKNPKRYIGTLAKIAAIIAVLIFVCVIYTQFTFSFGALATVLLMSMVVPIFYHVSHSKNLTDKANRYAMLSAVIILIFSGFCVYTLDNYFYPKVQVFTNADHNVVKIEGLEISNPKDFLLAANSKNALFDNDKYTGTLKIKEVSDTDVVLEASGNFIRPVYLETFNPQSQALMRRKLLNDLPKLSIKQPLYLKTADNSVYTLEVKREIDPESSELTTAYYIDGVKSDTKRFLRQGYALTSLVNGIGIDSIGLSFDGMHIVRPLVYLNGKGIDKVKDLCADEEFIVEMLNPRNETQDKAVVAVSNDQQSWRSVNDRTSEYSCEIHVPLDKEFSIGYDSSKSPTMLFKKEGEHLRMIYKMPMRRYLGSDTQSSDNLVLMTHSLNCKANGIDEKYDLLPDNIMLFDIFSNLDNVNRMRPKQLAFISGNTKDRLDVNVYDLLSSGVKPQKVTSGGSFDPIPALGAPDNVSWIVSIEDLKDTSIYQPGFIKWFVFLFAVILAVLMLYGNVNLSNETRSRRPMYSTLEFVVYMVTLFLVTLRWFLLWRASVFPPVEQISIFEWTSMFQKIETRNWFIYVVVAFVVIVALLKWIFIHNKTKKLSNKIISLLRHIGEFVNRGPVVVRVGKYLISLILVIGIYGASYFVGGIIGTWGGILCPIILYLLVSLLIHAVGSNKYYSSNRPVGTVDIFATDYKGESVSSSGSTRSRNVLLLDIFNALIPAGLLMAIDPGYGVIFLTFSVFWILWEFYEYVRLDSDRWAGNWLGKLAIPLIFLSFVAMVVGYKWIILHIVRNTSGVYCGAAIIGGVLTLLVLLALFGTDCIKKKYVVSGVSILVVMAVFGAFVWGFNFYVSKKSHTMQRIEVLSDRPDSALAKIGDVKMQNHYIQAATNHMIIGAYNFRGADISLLGSDGTGYFKMQPHSRVGAMWGAQLADIALVRFLIAEHSRYLGLLMLALFLVVLLVAVAQPKNSRASRSLIVQIPLLLFVQVLLIWMANTHKFIFLGQDYPMVSINSVLAIAFYFSLMIMLLGAEFYDKSVEHELESDAKYIASVKESRLDVVTQVILFGAALGLLVLADLIDYDPNDKQNEFSPMMAMQRVALCIEGDGSDDSDEYEIEQISAIDDAGEGDNASASDNDADEDAMEAPAITINQMLIEYQRNGNRLKSMSSSDLANFISEFDKAYRPQIEACFGNVPLGLHLWNNFRDFGAKRNDRKNVIHARLINDKGDNGGKKKKKKADKLVVLSVVNKYFNRTLPDDTDDQWRGSLIAGGDMPKISAGMKCSDNNTSVYMIPGEWMASGTMTPIIKGPVTLQGNGKQLKLDTKLLTAAAVNCGTAIEGGLFNDVLPQQTYIARNVKINGIRTFVYPMGETFYWARNIALELANRKSMQEPDKKKSILYNNDANLSLSSSLHQSIFASLASGDKRITEKSVVVANGDGEILAMVDYKKKYVLNPNDGKRIVAIEDSLYLDGVMGGPAARGFFGNNNLMALKCGPGSTQKPLTWTAVAAGIDYPWKDLKICKYNNKVIENDGKYHYIKQFNGHPFLKGHPFKPLMSDESSGEQIGVLEYMKHSSNVYNALMAYIGSWDPSKYDSNFVNVSSSRDGRSLFAQAPSGWAGSKDYESLFPVLRNSSSTFTLNAHPDFSSSNWLKNSLLQTNMDVLFGIGSDGSVMWSLAEVNPEFSIGNKKAVASMSYAERSALLSDVRSENANSELFMEKAVRSTAIGAQVVWQVTPLKMAEAFGRMVSLNSNLNLSIFKADNSDQSGFKMFESLSNGYLDARNDQLKGMSGVVTSGGTASALNSKYPGGKFTRDGKTYYLYAKTGTIGEKGKPDHHRFGLVITNKDMTTLGSSEKDLEDLKYVVLYFAFNRYVYGVNFIEYGKVIDAVIDSPQFAEYMK